MIPQHYLVVIPPRKGTVETDMARKTFHVVPSGTNWQLKHDGKVLGNYSLKANAIADGRRIAQANQPSELMIHNADGTIAERETYGNDPFPPRG